MESSDQMSSDLTLEDGIIELVDQMREPDPALVSICASGDLSTVQAIFEA